jgi:hypothetical protein
MLTDALGRPLRFVLTGEIIFDDLAPDREGT